HRSVAAHAVRAGSPTAQPARTITGPLDVQAASLIADGGDWKHIPDSGGEATDGGAPVEMTRLWKSHNDFHRRLEISHRPRDSHIPTSRSRADGKTKNEGRCDPSSDRPAVASQPRPHCGPARIVAANRQK